MARSYYEDPLLTCHFALIEVPSASVVPLTFPYKAIRSAVTSGNFIGFQGMTVPELTLETREIREGNWPYVHNVHTGYQIGGNIVLTQAVLPLGIDMYLWWLQAVNGVAGPRRNLLLTHTRADKVLQTRVLSCENCIPVGYRPASDFDANNSAVSLETLTLWTSRINVIPIDIRQ